MQKISKNISLLFLFLISSQLSFSKTKTEEVDPYAGLETERPYGKRWEGNLTRLERFRAALYRTFFPTYTEQYLKDVMVSGDTSFDKYDSLGLTLKLIGVATIIGIVAIMGLANKQANTPGTDLYNMEKLESENEKYKEELDKALGIIGVLSRKVAELQADRHHKLLGRQASSGSYDAP